MTTKVMPGVCPAQRGAHVPANRRLTGLRWGWAFSLGPSLFAIAFIGRLAAPAHAQEPVRIVLTPPSTLTDAREASEPGPAGVALSVVGRTPGVPAVLHAVRGTQTAPLSAIVVENTGPSPLTAITVSITWAPSNEASRRRLVVVPAPIAPGATARVPLRDVNRPIEHRGRRQAGEVEALPASRTTGRCRGEPSRNSARAPVGRCQARVASEG